MLNKLIRLLILSSCLVLSVKSEVNVDCSLVRCAQPICKPHYRLNMTDSCCGRCEPCTDVACTLQVKYCQDGEVPTGCCPCTLPPTKPDCSLVKCATPVCKPYYRLNMTDSCCGRCEPCTGVACTLQIKYCQDGEVPTGCCPCTLNQLKNQIVQEFMSKILKYCQEGELPTGCCPCTLNQLKNQIVQEFMSKILKYCKEGELPTGCCPCTLNQLKNQIGADVMCTVTLDSCKNGELPTGCCPCTPQETKVRRWSKAMCTMHIKYCKPGEKPFGCCPCRENLTQ
nr:prestalk D11 precursor protein [Dictyostelium discoideum]